MSLDLEVVAEYPSHCQIVVWNIKASAFFRRSRTFRYRRGYSATYTKTRFFWNIMVVNMNRWIMIVLLNIPQLRKCAENIVILIIAAHFKPSIHYSCLRLWTPHIKWPWVNRKRGALANKKSITEMLKSSRHKIIGWNYNPNYWGISF